MTERDNRFKKQTKDEFIRELEVLWVWNKLGRELYLAIHHTYIIEIAIVVFYQDIKQLLY